MPTTEEHVVKAMGCESVAGEIQADSRARVEWKLIILFYAAMHYVEAYFAKVFDTHLRSHTTRDTRMGKDSNLRKLMIPYGHLKFYGYNSRYEVTPFTAADINDTIGYLAQIKAELEPFLK